MLLHWIITLGLLLSPLTLSAQEPQNQVRFLAVDVIIDPAGNSLAAYQLEIWTEENGVKFVAIEGGEHHSFRTPPLYDPRGLQRGRLVLAAFTAAEAGLPTGPTRLITLHLETSSANAPRIEALLKIAAEPNGKKFTAKIRIAERKEP